MASWRRWTGGLLLAAAALPAVAAGQALAPTGRWSANTAGRASLPPMGWNSWNAFYTDVDEEKVLASAKIIVDSGLAAKGYRYVNIDDGWWLQRRQRDGRVLIRTATFPSARTADGATSFRPLTGRLHAMGLKAGIYTDIGRNSCGQAYTANGPNQPEGSMAEREIGLYDHVDGDIRAYFAEWGFDYIKVDGCGIRALGPDSKMVQGGRYRALGPIVDVDSLGRTDVAAVRGLYQQVADALKRHNPDGDYIFSVCLWGSADVRSWGRFIGGTSRTSEDITASWTRMLHNLDSTSRRALYGHPGSWNDPDMLFVGTGDFDKDHLTEARAHFSLWAMVNAPLLIGYDLRKAGPELMAILGNERIIALNQDPAGNQATLAYDSEDVQIYVKALADGTKAVAILNRRDKPFDATLTADHLKLRADADISLDDLWTGTRTSFRDERTFTLAAHQALVFRARGGRQLPNGLYLSELPGRVNPAVDGITVPENEPMIHRGILHWNSTRGGGERPRYAGWGGAQVDATPYGETLGIAGKRYATGLGVLANSRLEVRAGDAKRFTASVGVDDSARDRSHPVRFAVYGDGRLLARSKPMRFGEAAVPIAADVAGVKLVELVAEGKRGERFPDPVVWADAALVTQ
ncbi:alpha-galactosidase [Sphingomonas sp. Leaf407]|uniref:NPCBM/NEW2 domain-containing protein n=1 Tax=unclassified Sphingomonas TaxID=196159 RepID=UPI0006FC18F6|nr:MULTISPECIES: NPCBM/NEW2 domain-containing protein [unclassified Sphingomonas]KQN36918.1 alpha-galactosidase [Sphingomonas sp. Leaf42]KQT30345.1 alpha-galactosidase [Sphingomonas sp. Leaf407]